MLALLVNCASVIVGSLLGLVIGKRVSEGFKKAVFSSCGLMAAIMGLGMALESSNTMILLVSLILGGTIGHILNIEDGIMKLGNRLEGFFVKDKDPSNESRFAKGFMAASILFCSGAMSVVGSIQAGSLGDGSTIYFKSIMDGFASIAFASVYGIGVMFSSLFIFVYQGFFTVAASWIGPILGDVGLAELAAEGGVLLVMIGLGLLQIKDFKASNFLPSLIFAPILANLVARFL